MGNVLDYIAWRGDLPLERVPFGPADALALSALSYVRFGKLVPAGPEDAVPLGEAARTYLSLPRGRRDSRENSLLRALEKAPRFAGMELACQADKFVPKEETQFAALAAVPKEGPACLSFRGTDGTLVGWKEDFNLSFLDVVPAQLEAAEYIRTFAEAYPGFLVLGGHSKGGNLAVAGASLCPVKVRDRIQAVYSFDGPGFTDYLLARPGYQELLTRIRTFVPRSSVVGLLLGHEEPFTVVDSDQKGLFQHDLYSWQLLGPGFVQLDRVDAGSRMIDRTLKEWLSGLTKQQRETVVDTLYELLSDRDAGTLSEALEPKNLAAALKAVPGADPRDLAAIASSLGRLAGAALRALR